MIAPSNFPRNKNNEEHKNSIFYTLGFLHLILKAYLIQPKLKNDWLRAVLF